MLYDLQRILEDYHLFDRADGRGLRRASTSRRPATRTGCTRCWSRWSAATRTRDAEEQAGFRKHLLDYVRLYAFLSQVLTFADADLEKLYQFARHLLRKLPVKRDALPVEVTANINMDTYRIQQTSSGEIKLLAGPTAACKPIGDIGTGQPSEAELAPLSEILSYINEHFGTEWTNADKVQHFTDDMRRRLGG